MTLRLPLLAGALAAALSLNLQAAEENVLNLYSARHYQTDEKLYENFSKQTGIKINRIEGKEEELLERIKNEGANSPADVLLTVDASRLALAHELGLVRPGQVQGPRIPHPGQSAHRRLVLLLYPGPGHRL